MLRRCTRAPAFAKLNVTGLFDDSLCAGPTVLEVFNTLLRQLRLSVDYELTGSYDGSTNIGTKIIKAHEERQLQEAVIRTIGESVGGAASGLFCLEGKGGECRLLCVTRPWTHLVGLCCSCLLQRICVCFQCCW